jgi:truncated hemoglobin YjbI
MTDFAARLSEEKLAQIIDTLITKMAKDMMIGFHFVKVDLSRLRELELQHARDALFGTTSYEGRPIQQAHKAHRVFGGSFDRRIKLLSDILIAHEVDEDIRAYWIAHQQRFRAQVVQGDCA